MFAKCLREKTYKSALGIAVESRRTDKIKEILGYSEESVRGGLVNYLYEVCIKSLGSHSRTYKAEILELLIEFYVQKKVVNSGLSANEYINLAQSYHTLGKYVECAEILEELITSNLPLACQLALEISETQNYTFIKKVRKYSLLEASTSHTQNT